MTSTTTPLGLTALLTLGVLLLVLPRRYAILPVLAMVCYVPIGEAVMVGPLHFYMMRIMVIFGWLRILTRRELRLRGFTDIDKAYFGWASFGLLLGIMLRPDSDGIINRLGFAYDTLGLYFLFRALLRDKEDVVRVFKQLAVLAVPLAGCMVFEKLTGRNPFYVFGGVKHFDDIRDGVIRCQASFGHAILAGIFGATLIPYFMALWRVRSRFLAVLGVLASTVITFTAGSSGPVGAYAAALLGVALWQIRYQMRLVRRGIILMIVCLQAVMKVPFWWAISHISLFSGNTAWYRSNMIDQFLTHFFDWCLIGTKSTASWGTVIGQGSSFESADITNMFVRVGVDGGLLTLFFFLLIIVRCFRGVGLSFRAAAAAGESRATQFVVWVLGAALFAHIVAFFDVSYFDQNSVTLALLPAMISCTTKLFHTAPETATVSAEPGESATELAVNL